MEYMGFPYPITEHPQGYFHTIKGVDVLKADLLVLLLTNPGERVMHPEFGCDLRQVIFDPSDSATCETVRTIVIDAIAKWEPRLSIASIECEIGQDDNSIKIAVEFRNPENINQIERLEVERPLGGA